MTVLGIDHVELYVADLEKSAAVLCRDFGFRRTQALYPEMSEWGNPHEQTSCTAR